MVGMDGRRESGNSVLSMRFNDDDLILGQFSSNQLLFVFFVKLIIMISDKKEEDQEKLVY